MAAIRHLGFIGHNFGRRTKSTWKHLLLRKKLVRIAATVVIIKSFKNILLFWLENAYSCPQNVLGDIWLIRWNLTSMRPPQDTSFRGNRSYDVKIGRMLTANCQWVGSPHGLCWIGSRFFFKFWWVGLWVRNGRNWKVLHSLNQLKPPMQWTNVKAKA